jgi:hypothetical protein
MPLTAYERGYRAAQRRALAILDQQRDFGIGAAAVSIKVEMAQPVPPEEIEPPVEPTRSWEPVHEKIDGTGKIVYWRLMQEGHALGAVSRKPEGWRALLYPADRTPGERRELGMHTTWRAARRAVEREAP